MSRSAPLIIRLARSLAGEAAPSARVRVIFRARLKILFPTECASGKGVMRETFLSGRRHQMRP